MKKTIILFVAIITLFSCGEERTTKVDNRPAVAVKIATPMLDSENYISTSGKVEAIQNANISTRMMGFVNNIYVKVGDKVSQGQLLMSINSDDINAKKAQVEASITEATAAFKNVEKDYNRFKALFEDNSASQKEMDDMTAHYEMAKARLEAAKQMRNQVDAQLSYSDIRAPFSGLITGKFINKGDMANPGMPLLSIENPSNFQVVAMVPESEISNISDKSSVKVEIKSINKEVKGTVTEISTSAKNTGGQYLVKIVLDTTDDNIYSGMFATVKFPVNSESASLFIPTSALVANGGLKGVYTVSDQNTAILRWLKLGKTLGENVEVLSGLKAEEKYIISADAKLTNGVKVIVQ